jgi:hypothetical protein
MSFRISAGAYGVRHGCPVQRRKAPKMRYSRFRAIFNVMAGLVPATHAEPKQQVVIVGAG